MIRPNREPQAQKFTPFNVNVLVAPTPLAQAGINAALSSLYTGILISVPTGGVPVWLGNSGISAAAANGLEISPGVPVFLGVFNERQLYELQGPITDKLCIAPIAIPFSVWDVSQIYLAATGAPQPTGIILFPETFK